MIARRSCERSCISTWTRFMRRWSSGMIRKCAANPWLSRGAGAGPSSAPLHMKQDDLECGPQCQQFERNTSAQEPCSCPRIFHATGPSRIRCAKSSSATDRIEPLSLDEAYLDVSENKTG